MNLPSSFLNPNKKKAPLPIMENAAELLYTTSSNLVKSCGLFSMLSLDSQNWSPEMSTSNRLILRRLLFLKVCQHALSTAHICLKDSNAREQLPEQGYKQVIRRHASCCIDIAYWRAAESWITCEIRETKGWCHPIMYNSDCKMLHNSLASVLSEHSNSY